MAYTIKVSRQGLTHCPSCQNHIRIASDVRETLCPFCQVTLTVSLAERSGLVGKTRGMLTSGRSGLLAASLLGMTMVAGCSGEEEDPTDTAQADQSAGDAVDTTSTDDTGAVALYGLPPEDVMDASSDAVDTTDTGAVALYGLPPEDMMVIEDVPDGLGQPEYGVPPTP